MVNNDSNADPVFFPKYQSLLFFFRNFFVSYLRYDRPNIEWLLFFGIIPRKYEEYTLNSTYDVTEC